MKYIGYFLLLLCMVFMAGCEEKVVMKYGDKDCLYFYRHTWGQKDSITQSFFGKTETRIRDTVWVDVRTMGFTKKEARPVKMEQLNIGEPDAAVAGTHYVAFDDPSIQELMQVKADSAMMQLPVIVLRDVSLKQQTKRIKIGIAENEYFKAGIEKQQVFVVRTTDRGEKPSNWSDWSYQFGEWSSAKMEFMIKYLGIIDFDNIPSDYTYKLYLQTKARELLAEYNRKERESGRPPLCEDHIGDIGETCKNCVVFP